MRGPRMMALLLHLQVRGTLSARELANRLAVTERTIHRDVAALVDAGIPIESARGPGGGYWLAGGYRTKLTGIDPDEAHALAFLGLTGPADALGLDSTLTMARTKVLAALTSTARERVQRTAEKFHLDPARWYGTSEPTPLLPALADAIWRDRRVQVTYCGSSGTDERIIDPLGVVLAAGDWYIVAAGEQDPRTYKVSRFAAVKELDEPARQPPGFRLHEAWAHIRQQMERVHPCVDVTLRARRSALTHLRRVVAVQGQSLIDPATAEAEVELTVPFDGLSWARRALLGFGTDIEVLAPAELRTAIACTSQSVATMYRWDAHLAHLAHEPDCQLRRTCPTPAQRLARGLAT